MPPYLALALTIGFVIYCFRRDRKEYAEVVSAALWLPLFWFFITSSKLPSQWLNVQGASSQAAAYMEGNLFDRVVFFVIILLSILVLRKRGVVWSRLLRSNPALAVFLAYCPISVVWSDYPFVAFKRWLRDLGMFLTILVAVTDSKPLAAVCLLFRRAAYVLLPFSVTTIKYFP